MPIFDINGRVIGIDSIGIYEELEKIDNLEPACKLNSVPFDELQKFFTIANVIGSSPIALYYITAYQITIKHVAANLKAAQKTLKGSAFTRFEAGFIRNQLIDNDRLKPELISLADVFEEYYGTQLCLTVGVDK